MDEHNEARLPYGPMEAESSEDWFDRRSSQLEALAIVLTGEGSAGLDAVTGRTRGDLMWLFSDLITEIRHAHAAAMRERELWAVRNPGRVQESGHPAH